MLGNFRNPACGISPGDWLGWGRRNALLCEILIPDTMDHEVGVAPDRGCEMGIVGLVEPEMAVTGAPVTGSLQTP